MIVRRVIHLLFLAVFAAHAVVPAGFMVGTSADTGSTTLVICTGYGPQIVADDLGDSQAPLQKQKRDVKSCDFATMGALALLSDAPFRPASEAEFSAVVYRITRDLYWATPKPGAVSARGPPAVLLAA